MHAALKSQLESIATAALQQPAGPPRVTSFLDALGPIHRDWHSIAPSARAYGFLLFHAEVMHLLASVGGPAFFGGIPPYTPADFRRFGRPFNVTYRVPRGNVSAMSTYSVDVEDWHNRAHMAIEMATHLNMKCGGRARRAHARAPQNLRGSRVRWMRRRAPPGPRGQLLPPLSVGSRRWPTAAP